MSHDNQEPRKFLGMGGKGWGIIGVIVGLLAAIFYIGRRRKNSHVHKP